MNHEEHSQLVACADLVGPSTADARLARQAAYEYLRRETVVCAEEPDEHGLRDVCAHLLTTGKRDDVERLVSAAADELAAWHNADDSQMVLIWGAELDDPPDPVDFNAIDAACELLEHHGMTAAAAAIGALERRDAARSRDLRLLGKQCELLRDQLGAVTDETRCARCLTPFPGTALRRDPSQRHARTAYCRRCVDRCYEAGVGHRCVICKP